MKNKPGSMIWLIVGVFLLVMGLYFLINPYATLASIAWMFGLTMLVSGAADWCCARRGSGCMDLPNGFLPTASLI